MNMKTFSENKAGRKSVCCFKKIGERSIFRNGISQVQIHTVKKKRKEEEIKYTCYQVQVQYTIPSAGHGIACPTNMGTNKVKSSTLPKKATTNKAEVVCVSFA